MPLTIDQLNNDIELLKREILNLKNRLGLGDNSAVNQIVLVAALASSLEAQEFQRNLLEEMLLQLKITTKHWEIANQETITEDDLS